MRFGRTGTLRVVAAIAAAGLVLTACGSSNDSSNTTTAAATTSAAAPSSEAPTSEAASSEASSSESMSSEAPTGESSSSETGSSGSADMSKAKVGLAYDLGGRGDQSFNDSAARGLDKAKGEGATVVGELEATANEPDSAKVDRLEQLASKDANVIIGVGFAYAGAINEVAPKHPDIAFAIIDDAGNCADSDPSGTLKDLPVKNVACLTFAEEQGSYLVGMAAALKSKTGHVGFIGGVDVPLIQKFQAGFDAGAKAAKSDITIDNKYITAPPDFGGFNAPDKGETIAKGMYDGGADVIYAAAGGSGAGVFKAAKAAKTWGIGVDSDQYNLPSLADVKDVILTSMVKNVDVAVYDMISSEASGSPLTGQKVYDLKAGGVGYATSGGFIDDITSQLDEAKAKIISGEITVPTTPGS